jgi:CxxC-x17-CxxC domain-containing protein
MYSHHPVSILVASRFSLTDRLQLCATCGREFIISPSERLFYTERGYQEPINCPECRARQRADRQSALMAVSSQDQATSRLGTYGGLAPPAPRGPESSSRFVAVCSACGGEAVVPFEPRRGRPVYCRRCFGARRSI